MGSELKNTYPEFEEVVMATELGEHIIGYKETKSSQKEFLLCLSLWICFPSICCKAQTFFERNTCRCIKQTLAGNLLVTMPIGKIIKF